MDTFNRDVATPNWELRLYGAKELPESVCTCGSVQFSLPPRLFALSQQLLWPGHTMADCY